MITTLVNSSNIQVKREEDAPQPHTEEKASHVDSPAQGTENPRAPQLQGSRKKVLKDICDISGSGTKTSTNAKSKLLLFDYTDLY